MGIGNVESAEFGRGDKKKKNMRTRRKMHLFLFFTLKKKIILNCRNIEYGLIYYGLATCNMEYGLAICNMEYALHIFFYYYIIIFFTPLHLRQFIFFKFFGFFLWVFTFLGFLSFLCFLGFFFWIF